MARTAHSGNRPGFSRRTFLAAAGTAATLAAVPPGFTQEAQAPLKSKPGALDSVDVLVVGGGPAGIGAALGAARGGTKTLLIENHSFFGGVAAWSMGMQMNQMRLEGKPRSHVHELVIASLQ